MTALSMPAQAPAGPRQETNPRPVPWRKLAWVSWRQHRLALAGAAALLGAAALFLLIAGLKMHSAYASVMACQPAGSQACQQLLGYFNQSYWSPAEVTAGLLQAVPVLIGVFAGAPILARELETGTFRYAWTQGCGRTRWAVAELALPAVAITAATAAFSQLFSWYYHPFFAEGLQSGFAPQFFDLRGVAFAAWTLAAFAIGAFAGVLIRRVVPAMAAAMAAWTGLTLATVLYLRSHYQAPLITKGSVTPPGHGNVPWVVSQWWTRPGGEPVSQSTIGQLLQQHPAVPQRATLHQTTFDYTQWLTQHGYTQWTSYQPASRFWAFQLIEGGWLLALALLLIAATIWFIHHRAA
jgi:hypothetical protein